MTPKRDFPTKEEIVLAALKLGVDPVAMAAVAEVESGPQGAFDDQGRPTILYERHVFHRLTKGRFFRAQVLYRGVFYDLSNPKAGGYGRFASQWPKLEAAEALDQEAAWKSCSWGLFQIMGENHRQAGHPTIGSFRLAMEESVGRHLDAFVAFIRSSREFLHDSLIHKHWATFARYYNGPAFARNKYDVKLADAYARLLPTYEEN